MIIILVAEPFCSQSILIRMSHPGINFFHESAVLKVNLKDGILSVQEPNPYKMSHIENISDIIRGL